MYVCVYVRVCVCVCVCVSMYVRVHVYVCVHVRMVMCEYVRAHICTCVCVYVPLRGSDGSHPSSCNRTLCPPQSLSWGSARSTCHVMSCCIKIKVNVEKKVRI